MASTAIPGVPDMLDEAPVALLQLGIPVALLSWFIFHRLYRLGVLDPTEESEATEKRLNKLKKTEDTSFFSHLLQSKWMQFGGGFYGLAALWTFVIIEIEQLIAFLGSFPGFAELTRNGLIDLLVDMFINQIQNFVQAMVWFNFWADSGSAIGAWLLVAYVSYLAGNSVAKLTS